MSAIRRLADERKIKPDETPLADLQGLARFLVYMQKEDGGYYWYGHYYAAHAFHQVGGKAWSDFYSRTRASLLTGQS